MKNAIILLCGALLAAGATMLPQFVRADNQPGGIPTWEHLEVVATVNTDRFILSPAPEYQVSWTVNGQSQNLPKGIHTIGSHGWELVSAQMRHVQLSQYVAQTQWMYWFKRRTCLTCVTLEQVPPAASNAQPAPNPTGQ